MKFKKDDHNQYFIALVPGNHLQKELMELKQWVFEETGSKGALRSPAHITLHMPFKWKHSKEDFLVSSLQKLAASNTSFTVSLINFNCFEPRVVYIDVEKSEELSNLRNEVMNLGRKALKLDLPKDLRGFNPHITIAFRDLKKPQFYALWEQLKEKPFATTFKVSSIALLKHNGKRWEVLKEFGLN